MIGAFFSRKKPGCGQQDATHESFRWNKTHGKRIADHATSVAEQVVYLYEAKDIRHTNLKNHAAENSSG